MVKVERRETSRFSAYVKVARGKKGSGVSGRGGVVMEKQVFGRERLKFNGGVTPWPRD